MNSTVSRPSGWAERSSIEPAVFARDVGLGEVAVLFREGDEMPSSPVEAVVDWPQYLLVVLDAAHALDVLVLVAIPRPALPTRRGRRDRRRPGG